jgi:hypothetical protein
MRIPSPSDWVRYWSTKPSWYQALLYAAFMGAFSSIWFAISGGF